MNEADIKFWSKLSPDMIFAGADWCFVYNQAKETLEKMKTADSI